MGAIVKTTISLPRAMLAEIKKAVAAGEFTNTSEVIRDALRHWQRARTVIAMNDEELRQLVAEGRASGEPLDGETALQRLHEKYAAMPGKRG